MIKVINAQIFVDKVILTFSTPMRITNVVPPSVFSLNGLVILSTQWISNCVLSLQLQDPVTQSGFFTLDYTRPLDDLQSLQSQSGTEFVEDFEYLELYNFTPRAEDRTDYSLGTNYPVSGTDPTEAYPDDFIQMFGKREAIQITNLDNPYSQVVQTERIEAALRDAHALIDSYIYQAPLAGKRLVSSTRKRTACIIARYYLDSVRRRKDVLEDYERVIKELEANANALENPDELATNNGGILRIVQIPRIYDSEDGKGFQGWDLRLGEKDNKDYRRYGNL
jgi:phage gp36-like protein